MSPLAVQLVASGIQFGLVGLLATDKWVHKVTRSGSDLESRVLVLESQITRANDRLSEKMSAMTVYIDQRREAHEALARDVASLMGELRGRADTPDDRRNRRKDGR